MSDLSQTPVGPLLRSWQGHAALVVAGAVAGLLLAGSGLVLRSTESSAAGVVAAATLLSVTPATARWLARRRRWCGFAVGLALCWVTLGVLLAGR